MIILDSIKIKNFMSFVDVEKKFNRNGLYLIYGKSGSGKSSIFESIVWCIYGDTHKSVKVDEVVNLKYGNNCSVELKLIVDDRRYTIARYRKHEEYGDNVFIYDENGDEMSHQNVQDTINAIIGVNDSLFSIANCISNDSSSNILELTKSKRMDVFNEIFVGLSEIDAKEAAVAKRLTHLGKMLEENVSLVRSTQSNIKHLSEIIDDINNNKDEKLNALNRELVEIDDRSKLLTPELLASVEKCEVMLDELSERARVLAGKKSDSKKEIAHLRDRKKELEGVLSSIKLEIRQLSDHSTCPTCKQHVSKTDDIIKDYIGKINDATVEIESIVKTITSKDALLKSIEEEMTAIASSMAEIEATMNGMNSTDMKVSITKIISEKNACINKIRELNDNSIVEKHTAKLISLKETLPLLLKDQEEMMEEIKMLEFWKNAFNIKKPNNIKQFVITDNVYKFNKILNNYMSSFFEDSISLTFDDSLSERIKYRGQNRSYRSFSKGERKRINNAINFTFFNMARLNVKPMPYLFVDEAFDGLDEYSTHAVLNQLSQLAIDNSVYVISHDKNIINSVDKAYEVIKDSEEVGSVITEVI